MTEYLKEIVAECVARTQPCAEQTRALHISQPFLSLLRPFPGFHVAALGGQQGVNGSLKNFQGMMGQILLS